MTTFDEIWEEGLISFIHQGTDYKKYDQEEVPLCCLGLRRFVLEDSICVEEITEITAVEKRSV